MSDLIERLAKATGPDRELDAEIAADLRIYNGPGTQQWITDWKGQLRAINGLVHLIGDQGSCGNFKPPAYTASVDTAMTLVPEGWWSETQGLRKI